MIIGNKHKHQSQLLDASKDIALVLATHHPVEHVLNWMGQDLKARLNGIYYVYADDLVKKNAPLADLRKGWDRVRREIACFAPATKRILLMGNTAMLQVAVPEIKSVADIYDLHGTLIYSDPIIVPTFPFSERNSMMHKPWISRDVARCLKLTKPNTPLTFIEHIPPLANPGPLCIDIETDYDSKQPKDTVNKVTSVWLQAEDDVRWLVRGDDKIARFWQYLEDRLKDGMVTDLIGLNMQFDMSYMPAGTRAAAYGKVRDLMIRAKARGELRAGLKHLTNLYTARPGSYARVTPGEKHDYNNDDYGAEDIESTWRLWKLWRDDDRPVVQLMEKAIVMCCEQTIAGTAIDLSKLNTLADEGKRLADTLRIQLIDKYGVDPGQQDAFCNVLRERGYPLSKKTKAGRDALDAKVLEELQLYDLLDWRHAVKLDSSFVGKIQKLIRPDGMLPHHQKMMQADTGRSSMSDYNHQQSGRKGPVKGLLISRFPGGKIAAVDLAQNEVRGACVVSNDEVMFKWLQQTDAHRFTASKAFGVPFDDVSDDQRTDAKTVLFRLMYGGMPINEGQKTVEAWLKSQFRRFFKWYNNTARYAIENLEVTDAWGKTRNLAGVFDNRGKGGVRRAGINSPIQGLASHIAIAITLRIWELFRETGLRSLVLFGVHDSVVMDVHPDEVQTVLALTRQAFRDMMSMSAFTQFPMTAKLEFCGELQFGDSWADTKDGHKFKCSTLIDYSEQSLPF